MRAKSESALLSRQDMAHFFEGLLFGLIHEQFTDLDGCLSDLSSVQTDLYLAVQDFE